VKEMRVSKKVILSELFPLRKDVPLVEDNPDSVVSVRPLKLPEIVALLTAHKDGLLALYNESQKPSPAYAAIAMAVPDLITDVICIGAAMEDQREDVGLLPPGTQLQLLAAVWELSVPDPKKLIESLSKLMGQVRRLAEQGRSPVPQEPVAPHDTAPS
jgi:hypothetical protein